MNTRICIYINFVVIIFVFHQNDFSKILASSITQILFGVAVITTCIEHGVKSLQELVRNGMSVLIF